MNLPKIVFRHHGRDLVVIRHGEPCPPKVYLCDLFRIGGRLFVALELRPEHDDTSLVVELRSCSPEWALKMALEHPRAWL